MGIVDTWFELHMAVRLKADPATIDSIKKQIVDATSDKERQVALDKMVDVGDY